MLLLLKLKATIVIAYLMSRYGMTLRQAYTLVKTRRPEINPNPLFFRLLEEFERELMHSRLMLMNKAAAAAAQRNFDQLAEYNHQQQRSMLRQGKYFTLKPQTASTTVYNQRSMSPVPMVTGGSAQFSSMINNNCYNRQPYAY